MSNRLLFIFLILSFSSSAQVIGKLKGRFLPPSDSLIARYDTSFIDPLLDKVIFRYYSNLKTNDFIFQTPSGNLELYRANTTLKYGLGIGYRWLIFNWAFISPYSNYKKESRGKTLSFDSQINIYGYRYMFDFRLLSYSGYYLNNSKKIIDDWNEGNLEIQRQDINSLSVGGNFRYQFNPSAYSFKSTYDQSQIQKKSSGASFFGFKYGYHSFKADSAIKLSDYQFQASEFELLDFGLGGGVSKTWVYKTRWFLSLTAEVYYHLSAPITKNSDLIEDSFGTITGIGRLGIGYNSKRYYFGITAVLDVNPLVIERDTKMYHSYTNLRVVFVNRLDYSKIFRKF